MLGIDSRWTEHSGATYQDFTEVIVCAFVAPEHVHRYRCFRSRDLVPPESRNVEPRGRTANTSHARRSAAHNQPIIS